MAQFSIQELLKELTGTGDTRGLLGSLSRGKNVYNSTSLAAQSGGGSQFGRPKKRIVNNENPTEKMRLAIQRRLASIGGR